MRIVFARSKQNPKAVGHGCSGSCYDRRMNRLCILVLALGLAACGSPSTPAEAPVAPATAAPAPTAVGTLLGIGEIKVRDGDKDLFAIHANGDVQFFVENQWKTIGKVSADGKLVTADGQTGQLQANGGFTTPDGPAPFKLDGTALVAGDKRLTIENGKIVGGGDGANTVAIAGADSDGTKRTTLLLLGLLILSSQSEAGSAAPAAPPAAHP